MAILVTSATAIACQFIQSTDENFPLLYFTVDSTAFAGASAVFSVMQRTNRAAQRLRAPSAVAVLLSSIVYAAIIAPASQTGSWIQPHDDLWVRTATFLFHLAMPILVTIDFIAHDTGTQRLTGMLLDCIAWPILYLLALGVATHLTGAPIPYPFLDPKQLGVGTTLLSIAAISLLVLLLSFMLWTVSQFLRRLR